ncbi:unnamed protein product [Phaeothamnion confervicola]
MWGSIGVGASILFCGLAHTFAAHYVGRVDYVPGTNQLLISTNNLFGMRRHLPPVAVGTTKLAPLGSRFQPFMVDGSWMFLLLDDDKGVYYDRQVLLDLLRGAGDSGSASAGGDGRGDGGDGSREVHLFALRFCIPRSLCILPCLARKSRFGFLSARF